MAEYTRSTVTILHITQTCYNVVVRTSALRKEERAAYVRVRGLFIWVVMMKLVGKNIILEFREATRYRK
jgi:hypothetical protein